jgi:hypothetical protein
VYDDGRQDGGTSGASDLLGATAETVLRPTRAAGGTSTRGNAVLWRQTNLFGHPFALWGADSRCGRMPNISPHKPTGGAGGVFDRTSVRHCLNRLINLLLSEAAV